MMNEQRNATRQSPDEPPENGDEEIGESNAQQIWDEFRSHSENMLGLYLTLFFFFLALAAPVLSSSYPFFWSSPEGTAFPWFREFFAATLVDKFYNMSLLSLLITGLLSPGFTYLYWRGSRPFPGRNGRLLLYGLTFGFWGLTWGLVGGHPLQVPGIGSIPHAIPGTILYGLAAVGAFLAWHLFDWRHWMRSNFVYWCIITFLLFLTAGLITFPDGLINVPRPGLVSTYPERYDRMNPENVTVLFPPNPRHHSDEQNLHTRSAPPFSRPMTGAFLNMMTNHKLKELTVLYSRAHGAEWTDLLEKQDPEALRKHLQHLQALRNGERELRRSLNLDGDAIATLLERAGELREPEPEPDQVIDRLSGNQDDLRERLSALSTNRLRELFGQLRRVAQIRKDLRRELEKADPDRLRETLAPLLDDLDQPGRTYERLRSRQDAFDRYMKQREPEYLGLEQGRYRNTDLYRTYRRDHPTGTSMFYLGTDRRGNDMLCWSLFGARISLAVGFVATGISLLIGILFGAIAGYFGGWVDLGISRLLELVIMFPQIFLIIILLSMVEEKQMYIFYIMVLIGFLGWPGTCRLIRGTSLEAREEEYTMAARALGANNFRIVFKHILPNSIYPVFVSAPFAIAGGVILEGGLSLIGYGAQNYPSWGRLLNHARENNAFYHEPHLIIIPILFLFFAVLGYILIGFGLRDAVDPKMQAN